MKAEKFPLSLLSGICMAHRSMGRKGRNAPDVRLRMCGIFRFVPFAATNDELLVGRPALGVGIIKLLSLLPRTIRQFSLGDSTRTPYARDATVVCDAHKSFWDPVPVKGSR